MQRLATSEILLNQGLSDLPTIHAPIGSVKEIENFLVTERGLIKRPGIKHSEDLDLDSGFPYLNSQIINIDGIDCIVHFFASQESDPKLVVAYVKGIDDPSINKEIRIYIRDNSPSEVNKTISRAKLIYTGNNKFIFWADNGYVKAIKATKDDAITPPNNWILIETKDGKAFIDSAGVQESDFMQIQFAFINTPYVLIWKRTAAENETLEDFINDLEAFRTKFLEPIATRLFSNIDPPIFKKHEQIGNNNGAISKYALENRRITESPNVAQDDYVELTDFSFLSGQVELTLRNIQTNKIITFSKNASDWSKIVLNAYETDNYITIGFCADVHETIFHVKGIEFLDIKSKFSSENIRFIFKEVSNEEELPNAVPGYTVFFHSLEGYPKVLEAVSVGTLIETPLYVSRNLKITSEATGGVYWQVKVKYGLKALEFFNYTVFETDIKDPTVCTVQDDYISLVEMPLDVANYIITPVIANNYIRDVYYYQGRVGILGSKGITFSTPDSFFDFIKRRVEIILDTDPIDLAVDGDMLYIKPFDKYLILFGRYKQHLISWEGFFSLRTVAVTEISHYELAEVEPVLINNSLIFMDNNKQLLEFYTIMTQSLPKAFRINPYHITEEIQELVAMPSLNLVLGFTSSYQTAWVIYAPPLDKLENLYRPISKFTFPVSAQPVGEINRKLYFIRHRTDLNGILQIGYIDAGIINKIYNDTLTSEDFLAIDWYQKSTSIAPACNGEDIEYTVTFSNYFADENQVEFWLKYPETTFLLERVINENKLSVEDKTALLRDDNYNCIYDEANSSYTIPSDVTSELVEEVYAGIPIKAKVKFEPIPIAEKPLAIEKYTLVVLRLLLYGLPVTINFYRTEKDTSPFFSHLITGQIINLDYFDIWDYRTQSYKLRQPLNAHGLIEAISEAPDPLIIYSYQAIFNIYERGL